MMDNRDYPAARKWITAVMDEIRDVPCSDTCSSTRLHTVAAFVQIDRVGCVAGLPDIPSDPAVAILNPNDEITPESFSPWLDRRQAGEPVDPGVRAANSLAEACAAGEV
jgi:hypothetical protein